VLVGASDVGADATVDSSLAGGSIDSTDVAGVSVLGATELIDEELVDAPEQPVSAATKRAVTDAARGNFPRLNTRAG